jgi:hypothetical protein
MTEGCTMTESPVSAKKLLKRITDLAIPHWDAADAAIAEAFPDELIPMHALAAGVYLASTLQAVGDDDRQNAVKLINDVLPLMVQGYRLVKTN